MTHHIGSRSAEKIISILGATPYPLTIPELVIMTGKTYHTVKRALETMRAVRIDGHPAKFTIGPDTVLRTQIDKRMKMRDEVVIPRMGGRVGPLWDDYGMQVLKDAQERLVLSPRADPNVLHEAFTRLAMICSNMAIEIDNVKSMPDWYEHLIRTDVELANVGMGNDPGSNSNGGDFPVSAGIDQPEELGKETS